MSLELLKKNDFDELISKLNDKNLWTFNPNFKYQDESTIIEYLNKAYNEIGLGKRIPMTIRADGNICGTTSFYNMSYKHNSLSIGYTIIGKDYLRKRLSKLSKYLMLDYAFQSDVARVEFRIDSLNKASISSIEKLGAVYEGKLRKEINTANGYRRDTVIFSILNEEWPTIKDSIRESISDKL